MAKSPRAAISNLRSMFTPFFIISTDITVRVIIIVIWFSYIFEFGYDPFDDKSEYANKNDYWHYIEQCKEKD